MNTDSRHARLPIQQIEVHVFSHQTIWLNPDGSIACLIMIPVPTGHLNICSPAAFSSVEDLDFRLQSAKPRLSIGTGTQPKTLADEARLRGDRPLLMPSMGLMYHLRRLSKGACKPCRYMKRCSQTGVHTPDTPCMPYMPTLGWFWGSM